MGRKIFDMIMNFVMNGVVCWLAIYPVGITLVGDKPSQFITLILFFILLKMDANSDYLKYKIEDTREELYNKK